jgi:hypothetical protein
MSPCALPTFSNSVWWLYRPSQRVPHIQSCLIIIIIITSIIIITITLLGLNSTNESEHAIFGLLSLAYLI